MQFQYFSDVAVGGPREADYCPVYGSVYSGLKPEELDCRIKDNGDSTDVIHIQRGVRYHAGGGTVLHRAVHLRGLQPPGAGRWEVVHLP